MRRERREHPTHIIAGTWLTVEVPNSGDGAHSILSGMADAALECRPKARKKIRR
jgi:hypothetical protein